MNIEMDKLTQVLILAGLIYCLAATGVLAADITATDTLNNPFLTLSEQGKKVLEITQFFTPVSAAEKLQFKLDAIFYNKDLPMAVINGQVVSVGAIIDTDKKVTNITPERVELTDGSKDYYLELEQVMLSVPGQSTETTPDAQ